MQGPYEHPPLGGLSAWAQGQVRACSCRLSPFLCWPCREAPRQHHSPGSSPFPPGAAFKLSLYHLPFTWATPRAVMQPSLCLVMGFVGPAHLWVGILAWPQFVSVSLPGHPGAVSDSGSPHWICFAYLVWVLLSVLPRSDPGSPSLVEQPALTAPWLSNLMFSLKHSWGNTNDRTWFIMV